jgi:hypothetical protein
MTGVELERIEQAGVAKHVMIGKCGLHDQITELDMWRQIALAGHPRGQRLSRNSWGDRSVGRRFSIRSGFLVAAIGCDEAFELVRAATLVLELAARCTRTLAAKLPMKAYQRVEGTRYDQRADDEFEDEHGVKGAPALAGGPGKYRLPVGTIPIRQNYAGTLEQGCVASMRDMLL